MARGGWRRCGAVLATLALVLAAGCRWLPGEPIIDGPGGGGISPAGDGMALTIVNDTGRPDSTVYLMLTGNGIQVEELAPNLSVPLSTLPSAGSPHTYRFELDHVEAGRLHVSFDEPLEAVPAPSPDVSPVRFDWVELTYPGGGNLTAVDMFGIPMSLTTYDRHEPERSLGARTYTCYTDVVLQSLEATGVDMARAERRTADGRFSRVASPNISPGAFPDLGAYVRSMSGQEIQISGDYVGPRGPHGGFSYTGTFGADGSITMEGTVPGGRGGALVVSGSSLPQAVYSANGPYTKGGEPGQVGDNDVYSAIYRDLVAAFAWGYWGGDHGNRSSGFEGKPPFAAARSSQPRFAAYNTFAAVLYEHSDTYGFPFSDTYGNKNPFVGMGADVGHLQVVIHPDESPPSCPSAPWPPSR